MARSKSTTTKTKAEPVKILTADDLEKIVKAVPADRRLLASNLASELSFMSGMLDELKTAAKEIGPLELFEQGTQSMLRENPALKSYNTTIKNYAVILQRLTDMLPKAPPAPPKETGESAANNFGSFVAGRDAD